MPGRTTRALVAAIVLGAGAVGCTHDPGSTAAFCREVRRVPALESVLSRFSDADPDVLQSRIDKARTAYDKLADTAPSKIDSATDQVVSLVDDILDAVEQHPSDPAKAADQLRRAMAAHRGVATARAKVAAFAKDSCDVQLDPTLTDAGATTTGPTTTSDTSPVTNPTTSTTG